MTISKPDGTPTIISDAITTLNDPATPMEDKAAIWSVLYAIKRRIDAGLGTYVRKGPSVKAELTEHLVRNGEALGPLYLTWEAFDVTYPCNQADNWTDYTVQAGMSAIRDNPETRDFVRAVPEHFEIDVAALGQAVHDGSLAARALFNELKDKGWRTEGGRRPALKVREAKGKKAA